MKFLLLSCSPRGKISTSTTLLKYLQKHLEVLENKTELLAADQILRSADAYNNFKKDIVNTDYFIIAAPLYVDSLPSHVLQLFERLLNEDWKANSLSKIKFIAMVNSGFPDRHHNQLALDIYQQFATDLGLQWIGGIPIRGGAMLGGTPLENSKFRGRHARPALDLLAQTLSNNNPDLEGCIDRINKLVFPQRMYFMLAHLGWNRRSSKNNVRKQLKDQPYLYGPS